MNTETSHYRTFLLRLWRVKVNHETAWRASLEQVESGEKQGFEGLEPLFTHLEKLCESLENTRDNAERKLTNQKESKE